MGVDLYGNGIFSVNWTGWRALLELAARFGWSPAGTVEMEFEGPFDDIPTIPVGGDRDMGYFSNSGQLVTAEDAAAIAAALRLASSMRNSSALKPQDKYSICWITVEEFADFCSRGAFHIC